MINHYNNESGQWHIKQRRICDQKISLFCIRSKKNNVKFPLNLTDPILSLQPYRF